MLLNYLKAFLNKTGGAVSFEAIWAGVFITFFFAPTAFLYQYSDTNLTAFWDQRTSVRNEALNSSCSVSVPNPFDFTYKSEVNAHRFITCNTLDGEADLPQSDKFWKKLDTVTNAKFSNFTRDMKNEGNIQVHQGRSNTIHTKSLKIGENDSFSDAYGQIALMIPKTSQLLSPSSDYFIFDKAAWKEGHDKRIWEEFTNNQKKLFPNVYPSASTSSGTPPTEPPTTTPPVTGPSGEPTGPGSSTDGIDEPDPGPDDGGSSTTVSLGVEGDSTYGIESDSSPNPLEDPNEPSSPVDVTLGVEHTIYENESTGTVVSTQIGDTTLSAEGDLFAHETSVTTGGHIDLTNGDIAGNISASTEVSVYEATGTIEGSLLGGETEVVATVDVLEAHAGAEANAEFSLSELTAAVDAEIEIGANLLHGEIEGSQTWTIPFTDITVTVGGNASGSVGANASASGHAEIGNGQLSLGASIGAALGLGGSLGFNISINLFGGGD